MGVEDAGHKAKDEPGHDKPGAKDDNLRATNARDGVQTDFVLAFAQIKPAKINLSLFGRRGGDKAENDGSEGNGGEPGDLVAKVARP